MSFKHLLLFCLLAAFVSACVYRSPKTESSGANESETKHLKAGDEPTQALGSTLTDDQHSG